jgi:hypothetical protein
MKYLRSQAGFVHWLLALLLVAAIAVAGYLAYRNMTSAKRASVTVSSPSASPSPIATPDPYEGWKSFTLKKEGFSIRYPSTWALQEQPASPYLFEDIKLTSKSGYELWIRMGAFSPDGGVGRDTKIETVDEISSAGTPKPLKIVIWYDPQSQECCPGLSLNDHGNIHPFFPSRISDTVPGYTANQYQEYSLKNYVSVGAQYGNAAAVQRPRTRADFLTGDDYRETRMILKSIRYN